MPFAFDRVFIVIFVCSASSESFLSDQLSSATRYQLNLPGIVTLRAPCFVSDGALLYREWRGFANDCSDFYVSDIIRSAASVDQETETLQTKLQQTNLVLAQRQQRRHGRSPRWE